MRLLIAAKQSTLRHALTTFLQTRKEIEVVGAAAEKKSLFAQVDKTEPEIILLDENFSVGLIEAVIEPLQKIEPRPEIVVLGNRSESKKELLDAGVAAFVIKGGPPKSLLTTIEEIR